jgi:hypothetical protein
LAVIFVENMTTQNSVLWAQDKYLYLCTHCFLC